MRAVDHCALIPPLKSRRPFDTRQAARNYGFIDVDLGLAEMFQRERGRDFEESWMRVPITHELANLCQAGRTVSLRDRFAVDADSFAEGDEVRRREEPGAMFSSATNRIDHRAD